MPVRFRCCDQKNCGKNFFWIASLFFLLNLSPLAARAQQKPKDGFLSSQDQKTIEQLGSLNRLPDGAWKYHVGDIPHGEDVDLDDNTWQSVKAHSQASEQAVWYRRWIEVPQDLNGYDLTGAKIWFSFSADPNRGMSEILYLNGRRCALGEDLEPIVLFDHAKPGDKVLVAIKLLQTTTPKTFRGALLRIVPSSARPDPEDLHDEFLSAATLIPSLASDPPAKEAVLESAIQSVDFAALKTKDQAKFDASLSKAQTQLDPLRPILQQATFVLNGQSHIDAAWRWPWTETVDVVRRTFGTALQLMDEYPTYTFTQSATLYNVWMANKYPQMNDEIKQRIKEGRWEIVGGMWIEPDLNIPDGESMVRQLLIGKRWYQKEYGVDVRVGWNPDSFGYTWQLAQIYKKSGVDFFVTHKMAWNETNQLPFHLFWWESPDGSRVLTYFPPDFASTNLSPIRWSNGFLKVRNQAPGLTEMMDLYGVGDHGGGPTRTVLDQGLHWMEPGKVVPQMKFGPSLGFFTDIQGKINPQSPVWNYETVAEGNTQLPAPPAGEISIPTWKDDLYLEYHRGAYTTHADQKRNIREGEEWMLNAEKYASLAWLDGDAYPGAQLDDAWKLVLFNEFHDLAAGTGIADIYRDAHKDFQQVRWSANQVSSKALDTIESEVDTRTATGVPVVVFNPLAWERSGLVKVDVQMPAPAKDGVSVVDPHNRPVPSEVVSADKKTGMYQLLIKAPHVPSLGYEVLHVVPEPRRFASDLTVHGLTMENALLRVVVDPKTGCITSLYDKRSKFETLAPDACGNELIAFKDTPKAWDAWNIDADFDKVFTKLDQADSVQLIDRGPLQAVIRVTRTWQNSKFVQEISLASGMDYVNVVNDVDWHETHILLKAAFPLAASSKFATYEIPYGTIERPTTRNNSWEDAKFEVPALRWADLGDSQHGFSLINESKYGYDAKGNVLRLSLLRSPLAPDPNADRGHQHFSYALYPHAGDWKQALTVRHGYEYNYQSAGDASRGPRRYIAG